jgi:hypothetical protein
MKFRGPLAPDNRPPMATVCPTLKLRNALTLARGSACPPFVLTLVLHA